MYNGFLVGTVMAIYPGYHLPSLIAPSSAPACLIPMFWGHYGGYSAQLVVLTVSPARDGGFFNPYVIARTLTITLCIRGIMGNSSIYPSIYVLIGILAAPCSVSAWHVFFIPLTSVIYNLVKDAVERKNEKR